jgi:hypothetical protein
MPKPAYFQAPPPYMKRTMFAATEHAGAYWLLGGWDGTYYFSDVWRSRDMMTWHRVYGPTPPGDNIFDRRCYHHAVSFGGELHFFGGFNDHVEPVSKVLRDHWSTCDGRQWTRWLTPPWEAREAYGLVVAAGCIVLVGGVTYLNPDPGYHLRAFDDVWAYDADGNWSLLCAHAPFGKRRSMGCAVIDDVIYVWGGLNSQNVLQADLWRSSDGGVTWTQLAAPPWSPRGPFHYCAANGKLWMFGGNLAQYGGQDVNDIWSYDPATAQWTQHQSPPWACRVGSAMIVKCGAPDEIFLIGGMSGTPPTRTYYGDVWSTTDGDSWARHNLSTLDVDP